MTSELRPAVEVATEVATALTKKPANDRNLGEYLAAAVIEADRAPLLAEIERLREALGWISFNYENGSINHVDFRVEAKMRADTALAGDSHDQ